MFKSLPALFFLVLCLSSSSLWGQEEARSVGEDPWALTLDVAPDFGYGFSGVSVAMERRLIGSPDKFHQVGVRLGAQHTNIDFFGLTRGEGICGGAFLLLGKTHFCDLQAGGTLFYDRGDPPQLGWTFHPMLSLGYRYVSPGPSVAIFKVGIGTLGAYAGFGFVLP